jgi:hypothetical protein
MVEAAGVEPDISIENAQLTDTRNAWNDTISTIAKSIVRSLYRHFQEFRERQHPQILYANRSTLKFCYDLYT